LLQVWLDSPIIRRYLHLLLGRPDPAFFSSTILETTILEAAALGTIRLLHIPGRRSSVRTDSGHSSDSIG
jgi:hypothetical protein